MSKKMIAEEFSFDSEFKVGMFIEAKYLNPNISGKIGFNLIQDTENIPLLFNPRFDSKNVVLNSKEEGSWGNEEKPKGYDFTSDRNMIVTIYATNENFNILINDNYFYEYKYRKLNANNVKKSCLHGKVIVKPKLSSCCIYELDTLQCQIISDIRVNAAASAVACMNLQMKLD